MNVQLLQGHSVDAQPHWTWKLPPNPAPTTFGSLLAPFQAISADVPEIEKSPGFRILRGSVGKQNSNDATRVRTVLSPGMLGDFTRQVMVHGLTQTTPSTMNLTRDYLVLEGHLDVEVDGTVHALSAGDRLVVPRGSSQQVVAGDAQNVVLVSSIAAATADDRATLLARDGQVEFVSDFCGALRSVLPAGVIADVDQVIAEGLVNTTGHAHEGFTEDYLVTRGWIRLALYDPRNDTIEVVELRTGDRVIMPAGIGHKVLDGSTDNQILVTCAPGFAAGDESACEPLEHLNLARAA